MGLTRDKMEFAYLMAKHAPSATMHDLERLLRYGSTYKRLAETACNRELSQSEIAKHSRIRVKLNRLCQSFECKVHFQGDPRGCTVKIVVPDGYTNDWGREGICVPTA